MKFAALNILFNYIIKHNTEFILDVLLSQQRN